MAGDNESIIFDRSKLVIKANEVTIKHAGKKTSGVTSGFLASFTKKIQDKDKDYIIKNNHNEPKSIFNIFKYVSNSKENFRTTESYNKTEKSFTKILGKLVGNIIAEITAVGYNLSQLQSRFDANIKTVDEVFALQLANLMGIRTPNSHIYQTSYTDGHTKLCVCTQWIKDLETSNKEDKINNLDNKYLYYLPLCALGDDDAIGSGFTNINIKDKKLLGLDFGHLFNYGTPIKNIDVFQKSKTDEDPIYLRLIALITVYKTYPKNWFDENQQARLDKIYEQLTTEKNTQLLGLLVDGKHHSYSNLKYHFKVNFLNNEKLKPYAFRLDYYDAKLKEHIPKLIAHELANITSSYIETEKETTANTPFYNDILTQQPEKKKFFQFF